MKEMIGGCCVCADERGWDENPLVYCDGANCTVAVHQACYGIISVPTGPWYCKKCESQERAARVKCELCPQKEGAMKRTDSSGWCHVVCSLYIPEAWFGNVETMEPIILKSVPEERYGKPCYVCEQNGRASKASTGACMQCNKLGCKLYFHVTCAQSAGLLCEEQGAMMDNVKYCGYCYQHLKKVKREGSSIKVIPAFKPVAEPDKLLEKNQDESSPGKFTSSNFQPLEQKSKQEKNFKKSTVGEHSRKNSSSSTISTSSTDSSSSVSSVEKKVIHTQNKASLKTPPKQISTTLPNTSSYPLEMPTSKLQAKKNRQSIDNAKDIQTEEKVKKINNQKRNKSPAKTVKDYLNTSNPEDGKSKLPTKKPRKERASTGSTNTNIPTIAPPPSFPQMCNVDNAPTFASLCSENKDCPVNFSSSIKNEVLPLITKESPVSSHILPPKPGTSSKQSLLNSLTCSTNSSMPTTMEQLLERQWEQASQFVMDQTSQHFDIATMITCLYQLQHENQKLEEHIARLVMKKEQLLSINARLSLPLSATASLGNSANVSSLEAINSIGIGSEAIRGISNYSNIASMPTTTDSNQVKKTVSTITDHRQFPSHLLLSYPNTSMISPFSQIPPKPVISSKSTSSDQTSKKVL